MVLSSCVLGAGFAIMLFSRYGVLFWLGVRMSLVAFWSVCWDRLGTPTLSRLFDPKLPSCVAPRPGEDGSRRPHSCPSPR